MLIYVICGIVIMSCLSSISLILLELFNIDFYKYVWYIAGPFGILVYFISQCVPLIYSYFKYYNLRTILIEDTTGNIYYCKCKDTDKYLDRFYIPDYKEYTDWEQYINKFKKWSVKNSTIPDLRFCPKCLWSRYESICSIKE